MGGASMIARIGAIIASLIAFWLKERYGSIVMILPFSICGILAGLVCIFFLPETKGKVLVETLDEVHDSNN